MIAAFSLIASICGCKPSSPAVSPPASATAQERDSPNAVGAGAPSGRRSRRGRAGTQAAPGDFDFYLLNLSWSPEFCATHASSSECGRGLGFVVHGLWPQNFNGNYPERCSDAPGPSNPQAYIDLIPTVSLVEHEWQTHGTCSGLAADAYFAAIRAAYSRVKIPAEIGSASGPASVTPQQFLARFAQVNPAFPSGSLALSCGNNRLTAIELCLSKDLQPESCQGVRSCRANAIQIAPRERGE
jgi:ribonuclease T2